MAFEQNNGFTCRTAKTMEEVKELREAGFECVTNMESVTLFRKWKFLTCIHVTFGGESEKWLCFRGHGVLSGDL